MRRLIKAALLSAFLAFTVLFAAGPLSAENAPAAKAPSSELRHIEDISTVCMMNDRFMNAPQIPVKVGDKTYYGCCSSCAAKIKDNPSVRTATDPVTGKPVDKAGAYAVADKAGAVLYFESEETFKRYSPAKAEQKK